MTPEQNIDSNFIDLKTTRENAGLTLKDMFERTRISVVNLEAIENGDFHLLPVPIYTRNFIKTYAEALNVDGKTVLQRYENYLQAQQLKENAQKTEQSQSESMGSVMAQYKVYLWIFFIIIVVAGISLFFSLYHKPQLETAVKPDVKKESATADLKLPINVQPDNRPVIDLPGQPENSLLNKPGVETNTTLPPKAPEAATETKPELKPQQKQEAKPAVKQEARPVAKPLTAPAGAVAKPAVPSESPKTDARKMQALIDSEESSEMVIRATEETWVKIKADDQEPFQVLLKPGERIARKGARFQMDVGNAAGVRISFKGKNLDNLGKSGQVIHLRLP